MINIATTFKGKKIYCSHVKQHTRVSRLLDYFLMKIRERKHGQHDRYTNFLVLNFNKICRAKMQ